MKIIFMGTPDFAVPSLQALNKSNYNVDLVVTQPDRPKGRGRKEIAPPVKNAAISLGYNIAQPSAIKTDKFSNTLKKLQPDLLIVVAYGHILPENILAIPKIGTVNIHASLLPKYRGPAPIQWSVINREQHTGVTSMLLDKGMDTGDILLSAKEKIMPDDTSQSLHDRLAVLGGEVLIKTIKGFETNSLSPIPQNNEEASYAPLLKKSDGRIEWKLPAKKIESFIRGMSPWPGAFTFFGDQRLKIFRAMPAVMEVENPPGTVIKGFEDELRVAAGDQALSILEIQSASGKRLMIKDFLRGKSIPIGSVLG